MRRRDVLGTMAIAASAWPHRLQAAERSDKVLIGWLGVASRADTEESLAFFRKAMAATGFVEGRDFSIEIRSTNGVNGALPAIADALVALTPRIIVAEGARGALAAMNATDRIPIVAPAVSESVVARIAGSNLARPATNVTGLVIATDGVQGKLFEFAVEMIPGLKRVGYLVDAALASFELPNARQAAGTLGLDLLTSTVDGADDVANGVARLTDARPGAIVVPLSATFRAARDAVVKAINASGVPAVYGGLSYAEVGGLASFGTDAAAWNGKAAAIVARILRGEQPAGIPIEVLPLRLRINLKTAELLKLSVPPSLLARADEVIE